jgi:hypothetical protein
MLPGCQAEGLLTQTQMDALQVRLVEAPPDRAFAAASSALMDAGYRLKLSDSNVGIMTGEMRQDPSYGADVAAVLLASLGGTPMMLQPKLHAVAIQVLPASNGRSQVRIRPFLNGWARACTEKDSEGRAVIEQLWTLMQRQLLMKEPSREPQ